MKVRKRDRKRGDWQRDFVEEGGSFRARVWGSWSWVVGPPPDFCVPPLPGHAAPGRPHG